MKQSRIRLILVVALTVALGGAVASGFAGDGQVAAPSIHPAFANPPTALATPPAGALPGEFLANLSLLGNVDDGLTSCLAVLLLAALLALLRPEELRRLMTPLLTLAGFLICLPVAAFFLSDENLPVFGQVRFVSELLRMVSLASTAALFLLQVVLRLLRVNLPVILADIVLAGGYLAMGLSLLSRAGFNVSGIIATSAVLTAVIGFSLQDTLSNVMSGVVLEMENVINVGDWIRVGDVEGQVRERRWRQTTIQTRNWGIAVIPNASIMKGQVVVLGRRDGKNVPARRWVWFQVDLSSAPSKVMDVVAGALVHSPVENVAQDPPPNCICMDFKDGVGVYAVRYWLVDVAADDPTDSRVRERIYMALQRAGMRIAAPNRQIAVVEESEERLHIRERKDTARRESAIRHVDIFKALDPAELTEVASHLRFAPYAAGEVITQQGDVSDCLYMVVDGMTSVVVEKDGVARKVAQLGPGSVFGEMGLLTGEPRSATVHAVGRVECWRLDRENFERVAQRRPEIALELSRVLVARKTNLAEVKETLERDVERAARMKQDQHDLMQRISRFLRLNQGA